MEQMIGLFPGDDEDAKMIENNSDPIGLPRSLENGDEMIPRHHCAKCNTGYESDECRQARNVLYNQAHNRIAVGMDLPAGTLEALLEDKPGGIVRVGPQALTQIQRLPGMTNGEAVIYNLLKGVIGEDADREGLRETPKRVVKAWTHWTGGYHVDIAGLLKTFEDGAEGYDEMVVRKNIRIYSHCEHHLAPIIGECTIAYIPSGRVVGLSKLDRLADAFARRLQVQERLTNQIADALMEHLQPKGVGVHINARHMCIESRGVAQHSSDTITSALRGAMKDQPETRAEFMALVK